MDHLQFAQQESEALESAFEIWATEAERLLFHDLDGDQEADGYSVGGAFDAFVDGSTELEYVEKVEAAR